ncbi:hypothetical protein V8E52_007630 [Russula decolorans]
MLQHTADMVLNTSSRSRCKSPLVVPLASTLRPTKCGDAMLDRSVTLLMDFAKHKQLNGTIVLQEKVWSRSLVCLFVRFAPEFNSDATTRDLSVMQVEHYKRLLAGGEKYVTVAGCNRSEPLQPRLLYP